MPKDEFDFADPMELSGMALLTEEDTTDAMCDCFIEEYLRMGYNPGQVLALFRNPFYLGVNLVLQNRGEAFVRARIADVFARWGKVVTWPAAAGILPAGEPGFQPGGDGVSSTEILESPEALACSSANPGGRIPAATGPMDNPIPKLE